MSDQVNRFIRRLDDVFQSLWRGQHNGPPPLDMPAAQSADLLADIILADAAPQPLARALIQARRLLAVEPHGGNAARLVEHLAQRPPYTFPIGVRVPCAPAGAPSELVVDHVGRGGHKVKTTTVKGWLRKGHVIWLIQAVAVSKPTLDWLDTTLSQYPQTGVLLVTSYTPTHALTSYLEPIRLAPLTWTATRAWIERHVPQATLLLALLGGQMEARDALTSNAAFREALLTWEPANDRLASLYQAWVQRLLYASEEPNASEPPPEASAPLAVDDLMQRAAQLAWQAQTALLPLGLTPDADLGRLIYQASPRQWSFNHPALQRYLAAHAPQATAASLRPHLGDVSWREVIALWAAHAPTAPILLDAIRDELRAWQLPIASDDATSIQSALQSSVSQLQNLILLSLRVVQEMGATGKAYESELLALILDHLKTLTLVPSAHRAIGLIETALADHQGMGETVETGRSLIALAGHADAQVRAGAVGLLHRVRSEAALRELRARLADDDPRVGMAAAEALSRSGLRALDMLLPGLSDPRDTVRDRAIIGLSRMGEPAMPALTASLNTPDPRLVDGAAQALGRMGGPAISHLIQALGSPVALPAARAALIDLGQRDPDGLVAGLGITGGTIRERLFETLRQVGPGLKPALMDALRHPGHTISDLAVDVLADTAPDDPDVIACIANGLGDPRLPVRRRCEQVLFRLGPAVLSPALEAVADRPDLQGRLIELAEQMPTVTLSQPLIQTLLRVLRTVRVDVRLAAVRLLSRTPDAGAMSHLVEALADADATVRLEAARGLAKADPKQVIPALRTALETEPDAQTRAELLETLGQLDPVAAIERAIIGLGDATEEVQRVALAALRQAGARAVDPLIEAICRQASLAIRSQAIELLGELAGRATTSAEPAFGVARVWHGLLTQRTTAHAARERVAELNRWRYGREMQLSYATADTFHQYAQARDLEDASRHLYWIGDGMTWLRPQVQEVLLELGRLGTQTETYLSTAGLDTLAASDRRQGLRTVDSQLRDLEDLLDETRFDLTPFIEVVQHWRGLLAQAIIEASGEADLVLTPITDHVRLHNGDPLTVAVSLKNVGDGSARYVRVTLDTRTATQSGLDARAMAWDLPELEARQAYRLELGVKCERDTLATLHFRIRYEDAQRAVQHRDQTVRIRFYREFQPYRPLGLNPYIAGPPIKTQEMFFGRDTTLQWVEDHLIGKYGHNVVILYGERRTGKTSLLYQIERMPRFASGDYIFALVDFQDMAYWMSSTSNFYYGLAQRMADKLVKQGVAMDAPALDEYSPMPGPRFDRFMQAVVDALGHRTLVIVLDEFDLLLERFKHGDIDRSVEDHIRALFQHQMRLAFIFSGAHAVRAMLEDPQTILFNTAFRRQIGFLDPDDAYDLIRRPVAGQIEYDDLAVERILDASHGHAYFIQYICHYIFDRLKNEKRNFADLTDVTDALREMVQDAMGNIAHGYAQLRPEHRLILATLAKATADSRRFVRIDEIFRRLEQQHKVVMSERERERLLEDLKQRDFIETERDRDRWLEGLKRRGMVERDHPARVDRVDFAMDLVRIWLVDRADREIRDLVEQLRAT